jgi:branched-chain amino acid transport system ATP-binding protein
LPLLETAGLTRSFGSVVAVDGVDFTLPEGEIRAVIGPNGAGKTVFLHLLSGLLSPSRGRIALDGADLSHVGIAERVRRGITRSFQITNLFANLTVADNVRLAAQATAPAMSAWWRSARERSADARVYELLDLVGLGAAAALYPSQLAHGDQRHLEIALALAPRPRLLLLDEPTAGMSLGETGRTTALIRRINREEGVTIVIVEHDMRLILELAQWITVLDRGRVLADGTPRAVAADPRVREAYLGRGRHAARL